MRGIFDSVEVYLRDACEDAVFPVSVSEKPFDRADAEVREGVDGSLVPHLLFVR